MATASPKSALDEIIHSNARVITEKITTTILTCAHHLNAKKQSSLYDEHDFVQEVWVRLLSDDCTILKNFDAGRGTIEYFIAMIARREINNLLKKENALKRGGRQKCDPGENNMDVHIGTVPEPRLEARDTIVKLDRWLRKGLSRRGIDVFYSSFQEDEEPTETAEKLGVTTQIVYNWQHKIRLLSRHFEKKQD